MKEEQFRLAVYRLIKRGLLFLLFLEMIIFIIFGAKFFGIFLKNVLLLAFVILNFSVIIGLYIYFSMEEKKYLKER